MQVIQKPSFFDVVATGTLGYGRRRTWSAQRTRCGWCCGWRFLYGWKMLEVNPIPLYWEDFGGFSTFFNHPSVLEAQIWPVVKTSLDRLDRSKSAAGTCSATSCLMLLASCLVHWDWCHSPWYRLGPAVRWNPAVMDMDSIGHWPFQGLQHPLAMDCTCTSPVVGAPQTLQAMTLWPITYPVVRT